MTTFSSSARLKLRPCWKLNVKEEEEMKGNTGKKAAADFRHHQ